MNDRREIIKGIGAGSVWATPVIQSIILPAHAQTSATTQEPPRVRTENSPCDWDQFFWAELNSSEQQLWGVLGWNQQNWDNGPAPASNSKFWNELTQSEQNALTTLGFTQNTWGNFSDFCPNN